MKTMKHVELLLFVTFWWYLLIHGNILTAYFPRNAMYPESRYNDKELQHLILDTGEEVMITEIISESIRFVKIFMNNEKQSNNHDEPGVSWDTFKPEFLNVIAINSDPRSGAWKGNFLSNFI